MPNTNTTSINRSQVIFPKILLYILAAFYLVNCFTPLRLHVDMIRYFDIKDCIEYGCAPDSTAALDYLPYGYTVLLLILSKTGLLKSFTLVLINCLYLAGSLYLVKRIFEPANRTLLFLMLVLLNWTVIKFVAHPLSEMQYLFFSMASLYFFYRYTHNKKLTTLIFAFVFGGLAFLTRTVGIALAAALVTGLLWQYRKELIALIRKNRILIGIILLAVIGVVVFSKQLGLNHYTGVMSRQFDDGLTLKEILEWHFTEWTELFVNTSVVKVLPYLPATIGKPLFVIAGIGFLISMAYLIFIRKTTIPFVVKAYLFYYIILMFNWPFYDPRFWVPLVPLLAVIVAMVPFRAPAWKVSGIAFLVVYGALGMVALGYMTYTSLNKEVMARRHANGVYRNEYETVFFGKAQTDTAKHIDPTVLNILKRYNK
ncbi:MAG: hypothetical protein H7Y03_07800 [Chitinophagaceae bacterium]|nr:hypothetical protein [Chitinophagaceae bacterium]